MDLLCCCLILPRRGSRARRRRVEFEFERRSRGVGERPRYDDGHGVDRYAEENVMH